MLLFWRGAVTCDSYVMRRGTIGCDDASVGDDNLCSHLWCLSGRTCGYNCCSCRCGCRSFRAFATTGRLRARAIHWHVHGPILRKLQQLLILIFINIFKCVDIIDERGLKEIIYTQLIICQAFDVFNIFIRTSRIQRSLYIILNNSDKINFILYLNYMLWNLYCDCVMVVVINFSDDRICRGGCRCTRHSWMLSKPCSPSTRPAAAGRDARQEDRLRRTPGIHF